MFRPKLRYAHQGGMNPPVIMIHGNSLEHVTEAYKRFLEGRFRKEFDLVGTPLRIQFKSSHNPYADKDERSWPPMAVRRVQRKEVPPSRTLFFQGLGPMLQRGNPVLRSSVSNNYS